MRAIDRLRMYHSRLPRQYAPVPVVKFEVKRPCAAMKDGRGLTYFVHPPEEDGEPWQMEAVTPSGVSAFREVSDDPSEAMTRVESMLGFRLPPDRDGDGLPYDLEAMMERADFDGAVRDRAWGTGAVGRARVIRPILMPSGRMVDWGSYYVLRPDLEGIYD